MHRSYAGLVLIVSALVTASILLLKASLGGAGAAFLVAGALLGCVSVVGIAVLVRATVLLERARGPR